MFVRATWRITPPRREWTLWVHPAEQRLQTLGRDSRSKGRARKRYDAEVSAPTGQIWMMLPEK